MGGAGPASHRTCRYYRNPLFGAFFHAPAENPFGETSSAKGCKEAGDVGSTSFAPVPVSVELPTCRRVSSLVSARVGRMAGMTDDPFEACWYRWERAESRHQEMVKVWNDYVARDPHHVELVHQGQGVHLIRVVESEPIPPDFAGLFGEWLYNLRACLDYIIWAAAAYASGTLPPANEGVLQYPIYDDEAAWTRNLYRIRGLPEHQQQRLREMQPFASDPDANFLGWINRLARIDRHRILVDGACYLAELNPALRFDRSRKATLQWGTRVVRGPVTDVARVTIVPWGDEAVVQLNPRSGIDPEIDQWSASPFWGSKRFSKRIAAMQIFVAGEIAVYEYDCKGTSRREDALTEAFRQECDARGACEQPVRAARPADQWSAPVAPHTDDT
jgi:hypothetical protein